MKNIFLVLSMSAAAVSFATQAAENCNGFSDADMNCFENGTTANADTVNANFKTLLDKVNTLQAQVNAASPAQGSGTGYTTYVRWGRKSCPGDAALVYKGYVAGGHHTQPGGSSKNLCLTDTPTFDNENVNDANHDRALIYGTEYQTGGGGIASLESLEQHDAPCAVCLKSQASVTLMVPGTLQCPENWNLEYQGYLMGEHHTHPHNNDVICVDKNPETIKDASTSPVDSNGNLWYPVEAECGSLPCPPYVQNRELSCVVCSR
ncbi:hypothetical protein [Candidatus Venteria ishoeyi]|uniref:Short-chain collagen C4 n=1 Tax=Candidatus Venteria ishoeyi TaxID=1899563 RepID=A0A1H6FIR2_9GAMM|nr:hypothetical protein [Candidatus Venteria ishoeyi]SEH08904.1 Uncharacterised protein [Candidatus Venteria ishoeyi]